MKFKIKTVSCVFGVLTAAAVAETTGLADEEEAVTHAARLTAAPNTRYGFFDGLDHRSSYGQGIFPEPLLVGETDVENEVRLDWLHTEANAQQSDTVNLELEQSFGLMTLELEVPYECTAAAGQSAQQGIGNIDLGARHPFYQFVAANNFWDTTVGAAVEVGIPVNSDVSKNTEFVPKLFNNLRVGHHFTFQTLLGYATMFGGGDEGGLQTFESGFVFGYTLPQEELPLPGVQQLIPILEVISDTQMNHGDSGHTSLVGDAGFRANLKTIGGLQPRLGLGFVFPMNNNARADTHWGIISSLVFEY